MRNFYRLGVSAIAATLSMAAPAWAENAADQKAAAAAPSDDIIVTARRRSETLTSVPVSVTAIAGDSLASKGVTRIDDLQRATPSLRSTPTAGRRNNSQYELRGITTIESLITEDPAVGIYVNEVYRARATGTNQSFFDVENVQVLYGPQGTLFGRNSSAGAVLISTKKPTDRLEGEAAASYGNYNAYTLYGMLNVPFSDNLMVRIAGQRNKRDGYGRNVTNNTELANVNNYGLRASILWKPLDGLENTLVLSYFNANEAGTLNTLYGIRNGTTTPCSAPAATCSASIGPIVRAAFANQAALGPYQVADDATFNDYTGNTRGAPYLGQSQYEKPRNFSLTNTTTYAVSDNVTLKNIFGYNFVRLTTSTDLDATPAKIVDTWYDTHARQISDELQLQGQSANLNWVTGVLYFHERGQDIQNSTQNAQAVTRQNLVGINVSYAAFAQGTYKIQDNLSLTVGGRYTVDKRKAHYINPTTTLLVGPTAGIANCSFPATSGVPAAVCDTTVSTTFKQPTYTITLDYKPTPDTLLYISHRLGYRAGGFNARIANSPTALQPFKPEKVRDLEIGLKGTFHLSNGGFIRPTIAAYKSWYSDIQKQTTISLPNPPPATTTVITNAAAAKVTGFEATLAISPVPGLEFNGFLGYVDGHYENFLTSGAPIATVPFTTSKWTGGVSGSWTMIDTPATGSVVLRTDYSFRSKMYSDNSLPFTEVESLNPAQKNVNASLAWNNAMGSPVSVEAWVRNLTNDVHILGGSSLAGALGVVPLAVGEPRMYGLTFKVKLGN